MRRSGEEEGVRGGTSGAEQAPIPRI
uniref:Uncharacterized protein n=1 Tax=Arundo donax TaxID=35708 RepID=A0A0A9BC68_ARUDO